MGWVEEIVREAWFHLRGSWPSTFGWACLAAALLTVEALGAGRLRAAAGRWRNWVFFGALGGAAGLALWRTWQILWVADDAFISFRYARNFARGWGLVFNEGEWVEGYTNFLWTLLLGLLAKLGLDIPLTALALNLAASVLTLVLVALVARRLAPTRPWIPFAALALAGCKPYYTFSSSGLETIVLAMWAVVAIWATMRWRGRAGVVGASVALTASVMCRPDQALLWGSLGLALAAEDLFCGRGPWLRRLDWKRYAAYVVPFVVLMTPYFLLRWQAYGAPFPNTFYTKSGSGAYWSQGLVYLTHFLSTTGAWIWLPLFVLCAIRRPAGRDEFRLRMFAVAAVATLGLYVVRVGGDFMEFRFFIPLLPLIALVIESGVRRWVSAASGMDDREEEGGEAPAEAVGPGDPAEAAGLETPAEAPGGVLADVSAEAADAEDPADAGSGGRRLGWRWAGVAWIVAGFALAWTPVPVIKPFQIRWHLAAEETYYQVKSLFPLEIQNWHYRAGQDLHEVFASRGLQPLVAGACIGMMGYYSDVPLFDVMGLTSKTIGQKRLQRRGRPGHEKVASLEEILDAGAVIDFAPLLGKRWERMTRARVGGKSFHFLRYDPEVVAALRRSRGAVLPDPARDIRALLARGTRAEILEARSFFQTFLARWDEGPRWLERIDSRLAAVEDFETFESSETEGETRWTQGPFRLGRHTPPRGVSGEGWLTSQGREGIGEIRLPLRVRASELRFALGGAASSLLGVELRRGGEVVRVAHPTGAPGLQPFAWDVAGWEGEELELVVFDRDLRGEVGVDVDAIHFSAPEGDIRTRIAEGGEGVWGALLRDAEATLPPGDPDRLRLEACVEERYTFDEGFPEGTVISGTAFDSSPAAGALPRQNPVTGVLGPGHLNSFHQGDGTQGRVELPERELGGRIHLLVGGGAACGRTYVALEVGGREVRRLCGENDEVLRPVSFDTSPWKGSKGRLVVVDRSSEGWGHILVDDVVFQRPGCAASVHAAMAP